MFTFINKIDFKLQSILFYILFVFLAESHGFWELEWSEEFNEQTLDTNKWEIENEINLCNGNFIQQLNCNTNNSKNLQLIDGCLALTAVYEKYLDKDFTSAKITTKQNFTFGRFEIRAALPTGKGLRPAMFMPSALYSGQWPTDGQIDIMTNIQTQGLGTGAHYNFPAIYNGKDFMVTNAKLSDFHTYAIEWSESQINWFFDDINRYSINISKKLSESYERKGQPFDRPFKLLIHLGVGGQFFPNVIIGFDDVFNWKCSSLILDYVRVYRLVDQNISSINESMDRTSSPEICEHIMASIRPSKPLNIAFTTIISILCSILLIAIIPFVIYLFIRQKKLKQNKREINSEYYDDINGLEVHYDNYKEYHEYNDPNHPNLSNTYETTDNYYSKMDEKMRQSVDPNDENKSYLMFTNNYIHKNASNLSLSSLKN